MSEGVTGTRSFRAADRGPGSYLAAGQRPLSALPTQTSSIESLKSIQAKRLVEGKELPQRDEVSAGLDLKGTDSCALIP